MINVIVTAVGGGVGQSIVRGFKLSDLDIRIIGLDANPWGAGLYRCHKGYLVPAASDEAYINRVVDICKEESADILLPGSDPELPVLARERNKIEKTGCKVLVGSRKSMDICRNKIETFQFFRQKNLPFVSTVKLDDAVDLPASMRFPVLIKPQDGSASVNVHVVFNENELSAFRPREGYIAQEYLIPTSWNKRKSQIAKNDVMTHKGILRQTDEISIQFLVGQGGQILDRFTSVNTLEHGVPKLIRPLIDSPADRVALSMVYALIEKGLIGPCNLQCRLTEDGPIFFEINPRFTGITSVRSALGWNEPDAMIRHFILNEDVESVRKRLSYDGKFLCSRDVTDTIFPVREFEQLQKEGRTIGHGKVTSL